MQKDGGGGLLRDQVFFVFLTSQPHKGFSCSPCLLPGGVILDRRCSRSPNPPTTTHTHTHTHIHTHTHTLFCPPVLFPNVSLVSEGLHYQKTPYHYCEARPRHLKRAPLHLAQESCSTNYQVHKNAFWQIKFRMMPI